jgi:transcriptional regulator with XRE-family HTH domain
MAHSSKATRSGGKRMINAGEEHAREFMSLGSEIRRVRKQKELTLAQLASMTELSISFLSQVERNLLTPSVSALKRTADVLGIPAGALMFRAGRATGAARVSIVRRRERKRITLPASNISYELLSPDLHRRTSILWLHAAPGAQSGPAFSHEGEDSVVVFKGQLKVEVGGVWHDLASGDCIYFDSELPHRWCNQSKRDAEAIWVSAPPSF